MEITAATDHIFNSFKSDHYKLLEKIGEGGFGQVYRAKQLSTNQLVAIKFLSLPDNLSPEKQQRYILRFHREVDLISRLHHPNIVQLIDKGQQTSLLYAVYEFIDGISLKGFIANSTALSAPVAANIMAQVLDALAHAHQQGVIHRDIKPANIMLSEQGANIHVKVLDFGIGTLHHEVRQHDYKSITLTQETLGTPSYSAPEQLRGEPPIPQTDIYVWGLVFLECLTGKPTITGSSLATVFHQQLNPANIPLGILAGHESATLLRRVLNKKAADRPSSALEVYRQFTKINFSNLVGELSLNSKQNPISELSLISEQGKTASIVENNDDNHTVVEDGLISYTRLTERKHLTVLSIIINLEQHPATDTATVVNPDDLAVLDAMHHDQVQQCIDIALRYGAYHAGMLGDTLLFYFGYPQASDNDSRLCARTALDVVSSVRNKNALLAQTQGVYCNVRMGIQSGMMMSLASNQPEGKTAHQAMELCRIAEPNQILCGENVQQLLAGYLHFDAIHSPNTSHTNTAPTFILRGERQLEALSFMRGTRKNPVFLGRQSELEHLVNMVNRNDSPSSDRLTHIHGEAGIGKSRLVFELRNRSLNRLHLIAQCLPEHKNNALFPVLNLLKFKYSLDSFSPNDAATRLTQITEALTYPSPQLPFEEAAVALQVLLSWLNLPLAELSIKAPTKASSAKASIENLPPAQQKQYLFTLLTHLLCQAQPEPTKSATNEASHLFIFEDMHWADPTSLDFIRHLVTSDAFTQSGHSWVTTSRQTLPESFSDCPFTTVAVPKLSDIDALNFVSWLFEKQPVARPLQRFLLERTDGIPLFIEELSASLLRQNIVRKVNGEYDFVSHADHQTIPLTLRDSLQQKLDQLQYSKDTAQLAATIGREFDYQLLLQASEKDEAQLQHDLNNLLATELIFVQRRADGDNYLFKHALVRDAAYDSMAGDTRKHTHLNVANALQKKSYSPNVIAQHFAKAEVFDQAATLGLTGIKQAVKSSSNQEASLLFEQVTEWVARLNQTEPDRTELNQTQLNKTAMQYLLHLFALEAVLPAQLSQFGYGSAQVQQITGQAKQLLHKISQTDLTHANGLTDQTQAALIADFDNRQEEIHFKITWTEYLFAHYQPNRMQAKEIGYALLQRYALEDGNQNQHKNRQKVMTVKLHLAQNYMTLGEHTKAEAYYQQAYELYDETQDLELAAEYGTDAKSQNLSLSAEVDLMFGKLNRAYRKVEQALEHAEKIKHHTSAVFAYIVNAQIASFDKDYQKVIAITEAYQAKYGDTPSYFDCYLYLYYHAAKNDTKAAQAALDQQINTGQLFAISYYVTHLVDAFLRQNQTAEAIELMETWLQSATNNLDIGALPFLNKTMAACYYQRDGKLTPQIEQLLQESIQAAKAQHAAYFELENRLYLWSLYQQNDMPEQAQQADLQSIDIKRVNSLATQVDIRENGHLHQQLAALQSHLPKPVTKEPENKLRATKSSTAASISPTESLVE